MEFSGQFRVYISTFIFFGLWTSLPHNSHRLLIRFYSISVLLLVFCLFSVIIYLKQLKSLTTLSDTVANSLYISTILLHMFIIIETILKSDSQMKLIEKFALVNELFNIKLNVTIPNQGNKCEIFGRNLVCLSLFLAVDIAAFFHIILNYSIDFMFQSRCSSFVIRLRIVQVASFVYLLRNRLISIHDVVKEIAKRSRDNIGNGRNDSALCCSPATSSVFNALCDLKQIYEELLNIRDLLNKTFGLSLLTIFIHSFVHFTTYSYWAWECSNEQNYEKFLLFAVLLTPDFVTIGILCFSCSTCYQQVRTIIQGELFSSLLIFGAIMKVCKFI